MGFSFPFPRLSNMRLFLLIFVILYGVSNGNSKNRVELKYRFMASPKYSLNGGTFWHTRDSWVFKEYNYDFEDLFKTEQEISLRKKSENKYLAANIFAMATGVALGLALVNFIQEDPAWDEQTNGYIALSGAACFGISFTFNLWSYCNLKSAVKLVNSKKTKKP